MRPPGHHLLGPFHQNSHSVCQPSWKTEITEHKKKQRMHTTQKHNNIPFEPHNQNASPLWLWRRKESLTFDSSWQMQRGSINESASSLDPWPFSVRGLSVSQSVTWQEALLGFEKSSAEDFTLWVRPDRWLSFALFLFRFGFFFFFLKKLQCGIWAKWRLKKTMLILKVVQPKKL